MIINGVNVSGKSADIIEIVFGNVYNIFSISTKPLFYTLKFGGFSFAPLTTIIKYMLNIIAPQSGWPQSNIIGYATDNNGCG